jgi:hypothetical protein
MKPIRILIKFPTRSRPEKFCDVLNKYIDYLSGKHDIRFVITMDKDDDTMNNARIRTFLDNKARRVSLVYHYGDSRTKIEAVNADLEGECADILLLASDDMVPHIHGYDDIIATDMARYFPDFNGALNYHDGLRKEKSQHLMTLAVLGWRLYEEWGYIYHPGYVSLYADKEQTEVCRHTGRLVDLPQCIIKHDWPLHGEHDALMQRNSNDAMYDRDGAVFNYRKKWRFGLNSFSARCYRLLHLRFGTMRIR